MLTRVIFIGNQKRKISTHLLAIHFSSCNKIKADFKPRISFLFVWNGNILKLYYVTIVPCVFIHLCRIFPLRNRCVLLYGFLMVLKFPVWKLSKLNKVVSRNAANNFRILFLVLWKSFQVKFLRISCNFVSIQSSKVVTEKWPKR